MSQTNAQPRNPYYNTRAVHDAHMFFGRREALTRVYEAISNNQCISLLGPRSIGKSSLLECMCLPEIQQRHGFDLDRHILVFMDLRMFDQKTRDNFFTTVSRQLVAQARPKVLLTLSEGASQDVFAQLLEDIREQGFHAVLLMDAFDHITRNKEFDWGFFGFLKAQVNRSEVSYVTASVKPLAEVCHKDIIGSPFFTIFGKHTLGPLETDEACELVMQPSSRAGCPFTEAETEWLLKIAGKHPLFLQLACRTLFNEKQRQAYQLGKEVNLKHVRKLIYEELGDHFNFAWETVEEEKRQILMRESQRKDVTSRRLPELSESLLFRRFVRAKTEVKLSQLTLEDIREALKSLDDIRYLGESPLSDLYLVAARFQDAISPPTVVEQGTAVKDILYTAYRRLGPIGGTDITYDSRPYTVLSSLYFKERITIDQLAARLSLGKRQTQRKHNEALELLLNFLLEMEEAAKEDADL
jgi:hypothetical protein